MHNVLPGETFLAGPGEMRTRIREFDWARTPLGPVSAWSTSLRTIVSVLVNTHHPMFLFWGPDLIQFYNDGYRPSFGAVGRHPGALGARGRQFWDEIWPAIGPQITAVMDRGECTWNEDHLVPISRNGRVEEVYWTYGYSPVLDDDGRVGGTLVVVQEQTARVIAARRLKTVRGLLETASSARREIDAWTGISQTLSANRHDLPWVLLYALSEDATALRLVAENCPAVGPHPAPPACYRLGSDSALWRVLETGEPLCTNDVHALVGERSVPPWPEPVVTAVILPVPRSNGPIPWGVLVAGLSPRLPYDGEYRDFLSMVAQQTAAALTNARSHEQEERRLRSLADQSAKFRRLFEQAPVGVAVVSGPEHRFEVANASWLQMTHRTALVGLTYAEAFPELAETELPGILDHVYKTGEPFVAHEFRAEISRGGAGDLEEHFFTFNVAPVRDTGAAIAGLVAIAVDVTPQVQARRALRGAQERLDLTLDAAGVGHWDLRLDTGIVTRSLRHDQIFGYPEGAPEWTSGRFLHHIVREERGRVAESFQRAVASGEIWNVECSIIGGDDVHRRIHLYGRVERVENGAPPRFLGVVLDVTERHDLLAREQAARKEAEHASRMKDEFLATLSHELRTPLNTIIGWTDVLADGTPDADEAAEGLETIGRNARMLAHLIEDLLDMSRIVAGTLQMDVAPVRVSEVLSQAVVSVRPRAEAKGVTIHGPVLASGEQGIVSADADRLQQVFLNLLGNAVKFTPEGGRIALSIADAGPQVIVTVTDTGEGIAADFLPHIFERFRQADGGSTRPHCGLGLGLSLVKRLVALQGGTVTASSRGLGQGATFRVFLPATSEPAGTAQAAWTGQPAVDRSGAALPSSGLAGVRILVVDDDWDTCEIVSRLLTNRGADVVAARSAAEALEALGRQPFDLLVSDIGMPHVDGYDLIRQVRLLSPSQGGNIPAVAVTAYARPEDRQRALDAGFQAHIAKPDQQADLLGVCLRLTDPRA